jgi:HD-GYP domain-containing protein (c-di-GMP phosphodiesterase class II)
MSDEEAFTIVRERKGSMYDPLVVDTFIRAYSEIAPEAVRAGQEARGLIDTSDLSRPAPFTPLTQIRASVSETALLDACAKELRHATSQGDSLEIASRYLRQLTPASTYAFFEYESATDTVTCRNTVGDAQGLMMGLRIKVGERVSGWVAANRRTVLNSHPSLDLVQIASQTHPLRSTISTPLLDGERLLGVLTGYAGNEDAFNEGHRYNVERIAALLASQLIANTGSLGSKIVAFSKHP